MIKHRPAAATPAATPPNREIKALRAAAITPPLPGRQAADPPPLPFDPSVKQPTPDERAVIEGKWKMQQEIPRSLAQLIILVNAHPEWLDWAKAAESGTMTFNG